MNLLALSVSENLQLTHVKGEPRNATLSKRGKEEAIFFKDYAQEPKDQYPAPQLLASSKQVWSHSAVQAV